MYTFILSSFVVDISRGDARTSTKQSPLDNIFQLYTISNILQV